MARPFACGAAPLQFLSCYPEEAEETFPPLTLMKPVPREPAASGTCAAALECGDATSNAGQTTIVVGDVTFVITSMYLTVA